MSAAQTRTLVTAVVAVALLVGAFYLIDPTLGGLLRRREGFQGNVLQGPSSTGEAAPGVSGSGNMNVANVTGNPHAVAGNVNPNESFEDASGNKNEGFSDLAGYEGPAGFGGAEAPAGCYPRDQLTPGELLPKDPNSVWAQQNPMGNGSLKGKNFLSAGALIGVNTVGQSLRNGNYQFRSEPPNPQMPVSIWNQSTIEPDVNRRTLEVA